jgi:inorganic triphosphatase YgiF
MTRLFHSLEQMKVSNSKVERELKFAADRATLDSAHALPLLGGPKRGLSRRLESVYFDTEDDDLARAGVALRVRRDKRAFIIGLKRAADANRGVFERDELEAPAPSGEPEPALLGDAAARDIAKIVGGKALVRKFGSDIRRATRTVLFGSATIEVALDSGFLFAGGRREALHEIELELKSGEPAELFGYGLAVLDALPVRLCVESKAERAAGLLSAEPPAPAKARPPELAPETPIDEAIAALLRNCLSQFLGNLPALDSGDAVEAIHQMRVAMRRLRAVLGLFNRAFPSGEFLALSGEAKRIATVLGKARDWDVFIENVREGPLASLGDGPGFESLLGAAQTKAEAGRAAVHELIDGRAVTRFALSLERFAAAGGWRKEADEDRLAALAEPAAVFAARSLDRLDRKLRKRGRHFRSLAPEGRHKLRIAMKHIRYATQFFGNLFRPAAAAERYARKAAALQDLLGELNDATIALRLIAQFDRNASPDLAYALGVAAGWCARTSRGDERGLEKAWRSLRKCEPYWRTAEREL